MAATEADDQAYGEQRQGQRQEELGPGQALPGDLVAADELDEEPHHGVGRDVEHERLPRRGQPVASQNQMAANAARWKAIVEVRQVQRYAGR